MINFFGKAMGNPSAWQRERWDCSRILPPLSPMLSRCRFCRLTMFIISGVAALVIQGIGTPLLSLPLMNLADFMEVWFAGRADFGREQQSAGETPSRIAKWSTLKSGDCSISGAEIAINRDGTAMFTAKVKSK